MGLLDNTNQQYYYQGNDHGNYQFTSLDNIITQFEIAYVGENKIIPKIKRTDISFHAQRALQELSFDTLKSCKSQEITVPPSLKMILPHDYVNYTKLSWVDSAGIKHPIYHTSDTSNPFTIAQDSDGEYIFGSGGNEAVTNGHFTISEVNWNKGVAINAYSGNYQNYTDFTIDSTPGGQNTTNLVLVGNQYSVFANIDKLQFYHQSAIWNPTGKLRSGVGVAYQEIDVTGQDFITLSADGQAANTTGGAVGHLKVGITSVNPLDTIQVNANYIEHPVAPNSLNAIWTQEEFFNLQNIDGDISYLEWTTTNNTTTKSISEIDVQGLDTVYVVAISYHLFTAAEYSLQANGTGLQLTNNVDNISVTTTFGQTGLTSPDGNETNSVTWDNYKSNTPSENNINDYQDYQNDIYWPNEGKRYGLDPQRAQVNGSFYIDCRLGKIHFSSNISGRTVILDYISDSLGTDEEMQVHKFAEEAMYKSIAHAVLSTSSYGQALIPRLTKEKFAAVRKAKLRLSNLKLEELTQILRGK